MLSINPFTSYNIGDILNKPLYFFLSDQLNVCNLISPDDLDFFQEYYNDYYTEIVYYEYERPLCPKCHSSMNSNALDQLNQINGKAYVKNNIFVQNVEKHITPA